MKTRKLFVLSLALLLLVATAGTVWALGDDYNRPAPLMDYVPQEIGIYDTRYDELNPNDILGEAPDCRACHGSSLADRHHYTDIVVIFNRCTDCHEVIAEPPGVTLTRDCTTSGCHSFDDLGPLDGAGTGYNGWHHDTNMSGAENCVVCHDRKLVAEIGEFIDVTTPGYEPSVVTPTPFDCENCHWTQDVVDSGTGLELGDISNINTTGTIRVTMSAANSLVDGDTVYIQDVNGGVNLETTVNKRTFYVDVINATTFDLYEDAALSVGVTSYASYTDGGQAFDTSEAGHPGTFGHLNQWGQELEGYFEYGKPIMDNDYTHHMGEKGNIQSNCYACHGNDPEDPSWDPDDPNLIRYCEICHDVGTLHTIEPHVGPGGTGDPDAAWGWAAIGFHSGTAGTDPIINRPFTANEQCFGCHGTDILPAPPAPIDAPSLNTMTALTPTAACPTANIEIIGSGFGEEQYVGSMVQIKQGTDWIEVPVVSWTDTRIVFFVPGWTFVTGNHKVRVHVEIYPAGMKNSAGATLTIKDCASPTSIQPDQTFCQVKLYDKVTLSNGTGAFGNEQDTISGPGGTDGVFRTVQVSASQGDYIVTNDGIAKWNAVKVNFRFRDFYQDLDGDYFQDAAETTIEKCSTLGLGNYQVYLIYVFYVDDDNSGDYTNGDTVYQIERSNPLGIELVNEPYIKSISPRDQIMKRDIVRIFGDHFGEQGTDGTVRMGFKFQAKDNTLGLGKVQDKIRSWTNTRIKFRAMFPEATWKNKLKAVWVEKAGYKSNYRMIKIVDNPAIP